MLAARGELYVELKTKVNLQHLKEWSFFLRKVPSNFAIYDSGILEQRHLALVGKFQHSICACNCYNVNAARDQAWLVLFHFSWCPDFGILDNLAMPVSS